MKKILTKILLSPWLALLTLALIIGIRVADPAFLESVRLRYFDTLITSKAPTQNNVWTVNIDEATLDRYGQWPFKRDQYANLIGELYAHNAGLVVWNIMMPEKDRLGGDAALASTLRDRPVVLTNMPAMTNKNQAHKPGSAVIGSDNLGTIINYPGLIANIPELENAAAGVGIANTLPEIDGVNRRLPLFIGSNGNLYPSVSLEVLRLLAGDSTFQVKLNAHGVEKMRIPSFNVIDTDSLGRVWIDLSQKATQVSAVKLPADFNKGIVIVGTTAAGIANPVPTAIGAIYPQDIQAAVIGTLSNGINIQRPDWADGAEILGVILLSILAIFLTRWTYGFIPFIGILFGVYTYSSFVYAQKLWLVDVSFPIIALALVYLHSYTVKFITELNAKLRIKKQFGTYLSPALVEKLQKNPELLRLGGETRELSIMFTDVRGFTTISEHYGADVQGLTQIMNRYMTAMTEKILINNGTLDKYIGDAQMAFWNAPLDDRDHAINAVRTGLEMLGDLDAFNKEIAQEGVPAFGMGLGINTGAVVVGNMGSRQRFDYTCLGDSVNLASRLEGQSKNYGVLMVLGHRTAELVQDVYPVVEMDTIAVKGKTEGVKVYTVGKTVAYMHAEFLKEYYRGNWKDAERWAQMMVNNDDVTIKEYYAKMIERLQEGVPANWDGTYRATSK
jgi:adenylate cyclase